MRLPALASAAALLAAAPGPAAAADACPPGRVIVVDGLDGPGAELARLADLVPGAATPASGILRRGTVTERTLCAGAPALPWSHRVEADASPAALEPVPLRLLTTLRTLPGGAHDGSLWQGRGASALLAGGVRGRAGPLSFQLAPEVSWSQNDRFATVPTGAPGDLAFANPWYGPALDLPQRHGAGPVGRIAPGQSRVQLEGFGLEAGLSTESCWWGPGVRDALLLTGNAEGFPHLFVGTHAPAWIGIGTLEAQLLWGQLARSRFTAERSDRAFTALALVYQPRWVPGLHVGVGRAYVQTFAELRGDAFLSVLLPVSNTQNVPQDNQIAGGWFRWILPESGLELYGEFAREDAASGASMVRLLDRTAAWSLGFQKLFRPGDRWVRVTAETTHTRDSEPPGRAYSFYTHGNNLGWSHRGQLLGASIGPGADAQHLAVDVLTPGGRVGGFVERIRRNDEIFWRDIATDPQRGTDHDAELLAGARQLVFLSRVDVGWELSGGYRWNRDFLGHEWTAQAALELRVRPGTHTASAVLPSRPAP